MKLSIIILNYNTKKLLSQTIESINLKPEWEIVVVDNGSSDDSIKMMMENYPKIKLVKNKQNLGFSGGNNVGIRLTKSEYVMLLNSDTEVKGDAIDQLLEYMDNHKQVGAITPKVVLPNGSIDLACHRGMPTPWNSLTYFSGLEKLLPKVKIFSGYHQIYKGFEDIHELEATAATAMLVRRSVIDEIGLLDERFFLYAEDLDWCKRMTEAGYKIVYFPSTEVLHHKSQSGKQNDVDEERVVKAKVAFYETMKQFYDKHYELKYPRWVKPIVFGAIDVKKWWSTRK